MHERDFIPLEGSEQPTRERARYGWLGLIGLVGLSLIVMAVLLDRLWRVLGIWPDLLLNVGSGVLLFAVLFWAERRLVLQLEDRVWTAVERLSLSPEQVEGLDEGDLVAIDDRFEDNGQVGVVYRFLIALARGDYEEAWSLADSNWRLCRIQAWLYNNRDHFGTDLDELEAFAQDLHDHEESSILWAGFVETERHQCREIWADFEPEEYGASSRRRTRGPGYELVVLVPLPEDGSGWYVRAPALVPHAISCLVHLTDDGWRVAHLGGDAAPLPGWPPAWWAADDPAVAQWEAELREAR